MLTKNHAATHNLRNICTTSAIPAIAPIRSIAPERPQGTRMPGTCGNSALLDDRPQQLSAVALSATLCA
eukprot:6680825-Alexandrium_andersonii.AAC.1